MSEEPPDRSDGTESERSSDSDSDTDVDPFAELSDADANAADVEDPFAELDAPSGGADGANATDGTSPIDVTDVPAPDSESPASDAADAEENPFAELDAPDAADPEEDFFEEMETADIDEEAVWESVFEEPEAAAPDTETAGGADAVVRMEQYCKKCEHFSDPPELACNNPDTEIVELVGVEEFRVRNCPVVADRRRADTVFPDEG